MVVCGGAAVVTGGNCVVRRGHFMVMFGFARWGDSEGGAGEMGSFPHFRVFRGCGSALEGGGHASRRVLSRRVPSRDHWGLDGGATVMVMTSTPGASDWSSQQRCRRRPVSGSRR